MTSEKDLGKALHEDRDTIEIEGDLKDKILRIKVTGKVAWAFCMSTFAIAIASIAVTAGTGGTTAPVSALIGTPALVGTVGILGVPTTGAAIGIALAGRGVGVLKKLRSYRVEKVSDNKIILHKK